MNILKDCAILALKCFIFMQKMLKLGDFSFIVFVILLLCTKIDLVGKRTNGRGSK